MAFDVDGAIKAGYKIDEIADHLGKKAGFDVGAARQSGYSDDEIVEYLRAGKPAKTPQQKTAKAEPPQVAYPSIEDSTTSAPTPERRSTEVINPEWRNAPKQSLISRGLNAAKRALSPYDTTETMSPADIASAQIARETGKGWSTVVDPARRIEKGFAPIPRLAAAGLKQSEGGAIRGIAEMKPNVRSAYLGPVAGPLSMLVPQKAWQKIGEAGQSYANEGVREHQKVKEEYPVEIGTPESMMQTAGQSMLEQAVPMAASVVTGNPAPALLAMSGMTAARDYHGFRERGHSPEVAAIASTATGAIEGATELLPVGAFLKLAGGKQALVKSLVGLYGSEIPGEMIATVTQDMIDKSMVRPDMTVGEMGQEIKKYFTSGEAALMQKETIGSAGIQTTLMGMAGSTPRILSRAANRINGTDPITQGMTISSPAASGMPQLTEEQAARRNKLSGIMENDTEADAQARLQAIEARKRGEVSQGAEGTSSTVPESEQVAAEPVDMTEPVAPAEPEKEVQQSGKKDLSSLEARHAKLKVKIFDEEGNQREGVSQKAIDNYNALTATIESQRAEHAKPAIRPEASGLTGADASVMDGFTKTSMKAPVPPSSNVEAGEDEQHFRVVPAKTPLGEVQDHWTTTKIDDARQIKQSLEESNGEPYQIVEIDGQAVEAAGGKSKGKSPYGTGANWVKTDKTVTPDAVVGVVDSDDVKTKVMNRIDGILPETSPSGHPQTKQHLADVINSEELPGGNVTVADIEAAGRNIKANGAPQTDIERALVRVLADDVRSNRHKYEVKTQGEQSDIQPREAAEEETQVGKQRKDTRKQRVDEFKKKYGYAPTEKPTHVSLPAGWKMEVGKTRTKEGHTFEAEVDWHGKRLVFSEQKHMDNPEIVNHEVAHVIIETLPEAKREALFDEYIKAAGLDEWTVKNNFHHEEIAMDYGDYLTNPDSAPKELKAVFDKHLGGEKAPEKKQNSYDENVDKVVYHASKEDFETFDKSKIGSFTGENFFGKGFSFADTKDTIAPYGTPRKFRIQGKFFKAADENDFRKYNSAITKRQDEIAKELIAGGMDAVKAVRESRAQAITEVLKAAGYDGVIGYNRILQQNEYTVFEPESISKAVESGNEPSPISPETRRKNLETQLAVSRHPKDRERIQKALEKLKGKTRAISEAKRAKKERDDRAADAENQVRLQKLGQEHVPGVRAQDAAEAGRMWEMKENGDVSAQEWYDYVADLVASNKVAKAADPNIGREWDSPYYGRQRIVSRDTTGPGVIYDVQTIGKDEIRRYRADQIEFIISRDEYALTPEYEAEQRERAENAKLKEEREARQAEKDKQIDEEIAAFTSGMSNIAAGKAKAVLLKRFRFSDGAMTRKECVEKRIAEGHTVTGEGSERRLEDAEGVGLGEKKLSKTGMDYAEFLLGRKEAEYGSQQGKPEEETKVRQLVKDIRKQRVEEFKKKYGYAEDTEKTASQNAPENPAKTEPENPIFTEDAYQKAKARMKAKLSQLNAGFDPELLQDGMTIAGYHLERGARKFAEYAKSMVDDFGDSIRPYLKAFYNGVRDLPGIAWTGEMDDYQTVQGASIEAKEETAFPDSERSLDRSDTWKMVDSEVSGNSKDRDAVMKILDKEYNSLVKAKKLFGPFGFTEADIKNAVETYLSDKASTAEKKKEERELMRQAEEIAKSDDKVRDLLFSVTNLKSRMESVASERGMYGVKWAEKNVSNRWYSLSKEYRATKDRLISALRSASVKIKPAETSDNKAISALQEIISRISTITKASEAAQLDSDISKVSGEIKRFDSNLAYKLMKKGEEGAYAAVKLNTTKDISNYSHVVEKQKVGDLRTAIDEAVKLLEKEDLNNARIRRELEESSSSISFSPEQAIKSAADSIEELRPVDVYRVLRETPEEHREAVKQYILKNHASNQRMQDEVRKAMESFVEEKKDNDAYVDLEKQAGYEEDAYEWIAGHIKAKTYGWKSEADIDRAFAKFEERWRGESPVSKENFASMFKAQISEVAPKAAVSTPDTPATVVKEAVQAAKEEGISLKEQKKYLLENLDEAIKAAPKEHPDMAAFNKLSDKRAAKRQAYDDAQSRKEDCASEVRTTETFIADGKIGSIEFTDEEMRKYRDRLPEEKERLEEATRKARIAKSELDTVQSELRDRFMVTIEVPNDGTFDVYNTKEAIKEFKEKIASKFPTTEKESTGPKGYGKLPKPTGVKAEGLEGGAVIPTDDGVWHTNGHIAVKGEPAVKFKSASESIRSDMTPEEGAEMMAKIIPKANTGNPVASVEFAAGKGAMDSNADFRATSTEPIKTTKDEVGYVRLTTEAGVSAVLSQKLYIYANQAYPKAGIRVKGENDPVTFVENGEVVAVVMPIRGGRLEGYFDREEEIPEPSVAAKGEPVVVEEEKKPSSKIEDFGEKLGNARKDRQVSLDVEYDDKDIARLPLSEIWPKKEIDGIEDTFIAAVATVARAVIPSKPRQAYKVNRWVERVKGVRGLAKMVQDMDRTEFFEKAKGYRLEGFIAKINLLENIDREQWGRIGDVREYPDAYRYEKQEDGTNKQIPSPYSSVEIDGNNRTFRVASLSEAMPQIMELLGGEKAKAKMQFEVRGRGDKWFINKKGDPLYRPLKTFTDSGEAVKFGRDKNNYDVLAQSWEAIKERENVKERDVRREDNRPRTGADYRKGKDATPEMFKSAFGFRGVEFGNWVSQGKNSKERQGMLNSAYDAMMDLSDILGVPSQALSLNGTLGLAFGSRGSGWASAHYEPSNLVINLTKTRGAGALAHELFHAIDNYFQLKRGQDRTNAREGNYITYQPESYYQEENTGHRLSVRRFREINARGGIRNADNWKIQEGVRPEVGEAFAGLVKALDESPMAKRSALIDKGKGGGYWSRVIERAARAFENYVIFKMQQKGYQNDYLANVVTSEEFGRDGSRYPYLTPSELTPVAEAFDNLFSTIKSEKTDRGVALYSYRKSPATKGTQKSAIEKAITPLLKKWKNAPEVVVVQSESDLPANEIADIASKNAQGEIGGIFTKDIIYLIADNIARKEDAVKTLLHEMVGHYGVRGLMGRKFNSLLQDVYYLYGEKGLRDIANRYDLDLSNPDDRLIAAEEKLAELAESGEKPGLIRRAIAMIRGWLKSIGVDISLSDNDVKAIISRAARWVERGLEDGRDDKGDTPRYSRRNRTGDPDTDAVLDKIGRPDKTIMERIRDIIKERAPLRVEQGLFDQFAAIKQYDETAYIMTRMTTGFSDTFMAMLEHGAPIWANGWVKVDSRDNGIMKIFEPVAEDLDLFLGWMVGERAQKLMNEGRENYFTQAEINKLKALKTPENAVRWENVRINYVQYKKKVLDFAEQAGVINSEARKVWDHEEYVPFYRITEEANGTSKVQGPRGKRGIASQHSGIRTLKGGTSQLGDVFENILQNFSHLVHASIKNRAATEALRAAEAAGAASTVKWDWKAAHIETKQIVKKIREELGADDILEDEEDQLDDFLTLFYLARPKGTAIVHYLEDGKPKYYEVHDDLLLRSLTNINSQPFQGYFMDLARMTKRLMTVGITSMPGFMVRNIARDTVHVAAISGTNFIPVVSSMQGFMKAFREDDDMMQLMAAGGSFHGGWAYGHDMKKAADHAKHLMRKKGVNSGVIDSIAKLWDAYQKVGSAMENAARVKVYDLELRDTGDHLRAAYKAKDLMDFSLHGDWKAVKFLCETVIFLQARIQSLHRLGRAAWIKQQLKSMAVVGTSIALASVLLYLFNRDDDRYKELEEWDKDTFWHFWIGEHHFRFPKPFEVGALFGTMAERITELAIEEAHDGKLFASRLYHMLTQTFALGLPHVGSELYQQAANKDSFTGRPIVNSRLKGMLPEDQKEPWTSETAIALAKVPGPSLMGPKRLEHFIEGYTGTLGAFVMGCSDMIIRKSMGYPDRPAMTPAEYPIVGSFYRGKDDRGRNTKYVTEFYNLMNEVDETYRSVQGARQLGNAERYEEIVSDEKQRDLLNIKKPLDKRRKDFTDINRETRRIYADREMTPKQKRERLNELTGIKNDIAKDTIRRIEAAGISIPR